MKKYIFLTSVLALAACGGGSGGIVSSDGNSDDGGFSDSDSGNVIVVPIDTTKKTVPAELEGRIATTAATSNETITKMKSEIVVSSNSDVELARAGHSYTDANGVVFKSYRLEDVKLYAADAKHTNDGYLKIGMNKDTGHIDSVKLVVGGGEADAVPVARVGETAKFESPIFEYVTDRYAKVKGTEFSVSDGPDYFMNAIATARHFSEGYWEHQGNGVYKYKIGDFFAQVNNQDFSVQNNTNALLSAVKDAYNFNGGQWVKENGMYKYVEYGDQAIYRIVDTGQNKEQLDNIANNEHFAMGHWNRIDEFMNVATYGRDIGNGKSLQYADFGHFNPVWKTKLVDLTGKVDGDWNSEDAEIPHTDEEMEEWMNQDEDYQLFAGGYAISGTELKDTLDVPMNTSFKGMAIGRLYTSLQGGDRNARGGHFATYGITDTGDNDDGYDIAKAFVTQEATLTVDADGKQTLFMPFNTHAVGDKYYDVTLVKNLDESIETPVFDGDEDAVATQYRLYDALERVVTGENSLNIGYYGVNMVSETAGTARLYSEKDLDGVVSREYELQAAFGMKRQ